VKISTQLAILEDVRRLAPCALTRQKLNQLLANRRSSWHAPKSFGVDDLIDLLEENGSLNTAEITSEEYGHKDRYVIGDVSFPQLALSFYKDSYLSHGTALDLHGLASFKEILVNHEQSPKPGGGKGQLNQSGLDQAFSNQPRRSNYIFRYGRRTITFLNGKNTGRAGVVEKPGANGEPLHVTGIERTLIDVIVRPQYAGGIQNVRKAFEAARDRVSVGEMAMLLAKIKHLYPYHQALGFMLQKAGMDEETLSPLRKPKIRFKFYLEYAMKAPKYDPVWQLYYPSDF
jgi:hypothetical protein